MTRRASTSPLIQRLVQDGWRFWIRRDVAARCAPAGSELGTWLSNVVRGEVNVDRVLKQDDQRSTVQLVTVGERQWIIKRYHRTPRLVARMRKSPAWFEWRGADNLVRAGVRCNRALALARSAGVRDEVLVMPYVVGDCLHHVIADAPRQAHWNDTYRRWRREVARHMGRQIAKLAAAGLTNRDHKIGNLIMDEDCRQLRDEPVLIDPVGVVRRRRASQLVRLLAQLNATAAGAGTVTRGEQYHVLKAVAGMGPGRSEAECRARMRELAQCVRGYPSTSATGKTHG